MKCIKDIVNTFSEEEKELHSELIEECLEREQEIIENEGVALEKLEKMTDITTRLIRDLEKQLRLINQVVLEQSINEIPESEFFEA